MALNFYYDGFDCGHWGIMNDPDCFYPGFKDELQRVIDEKKSFDTDWYSFKKELESIRISSDGNTVTVHVFCYMDDAEDLPYDAEESLTEDEANEAIDMWYDSYCLCSTEYTAAQDIDVSECTMDKILEVASDLAETCNKELKSAFHVMQAICEEIVNNRKDDDDEQTETV